MTDKGSSKWTPDQPHSAGPNNEATQQFGAVPQQQYPQPPYGQQYPASYQQPEKRGGPNTWLLVLVALLLAALVGVLAFLGGSGAFTRTSEPVTSTVVETHTLPSSSAQSPEPAAPAPEPAVKTRTYSHYAPDTSVTTASFAPNVFAAFQDAYASTGTTEVTVSAYSPETKLTYRMSCSGDEVVYCSGGNNARVRIW